MFIRIVILFFGEMTFREDMNVGMVLRKDTCLKPDQNLEYPVADTD